MVIRKIKMTGSMTTLAACIDNRSLPALQREAYSHFTSVSRPLTQICSRFPDRAMSSVLPRHSARHLYLIPRFPRSQFMYSRTQFFPCRNLCLGIFVSLLLTVSAFPQTKLGQDNQPSTQGKVLAGYFEEWSIYYANYNLADLESNGSAARLSHLFFAFANVTPTTCTIADEWADFETPYLPPVGGIASTWPVFGNFAELQKLKQLHPNLK